MLLRHLRGLTAASALVLGLPTPAGAQGIEVVKTLGSCGRVRPLDASRWFKINWRMVSDLEPSFSVLDADAGEVRELRPPVRAYLEANRALFLRPGARSIFPDLVAYAPERQEAALLVPHERRVGHKLLTYLHWDLAENRILWHATLGSIQDDPLAPQVDRFIQSLGVDQAAQKHYFWRYRDARDKQQNRLAEEEITVFRLDLVTHQIDWSYAFKMLDRFGHVNAAAANKDFTRFAFTEYHEGVLPGRSRERAGNAYLVDRVRGTTTTFFAPLTPYGLTFDPLGKYLVIGSNQVGKVYRYEATTGRLLGNGPTLGGIQHIAFSPGGQWLFVFASTEPSPSPRRPYIQAVPWPTLAKGRRMDAFGVRPDVALGVNTGGTTSAGKHGVLVNWVDHARCYLLRLKD